jgi:hypothetical protein
MSDTQENKFKAKLVHYKTGETIVFQAAPDISESRSVEYQTVNPIHMPGSILAYVTSPSRTFGVGSIKLISFTPEQAQKNIQDLQTLRSWCLPRFGLGDAYWGENDVPLKRERALPPSVDPDVIKAAQARLNQQNAQKQTAAIQSHNESVNQQKLLGMPPPILYFSAYSSPNSSGGSPKFLQNINRIPVVITSLEISYPSDVDYIPTQNGVPFPTIMTISLSLTETHSPKTFAKFDLDDFRAGRLGGF